MIVRVLGCHGSDLRGHHPPGFLVDGHLLLEAGTATGKLSLTAQRRIRWVVISHSHFDHIKDLPFLTDNMKDSRGQVLSVLSIEPVIRALKEHIFNDLIWPDFTQIPSPDEPRMNCTVLHPGLTVPVGDYRLTPVPTKHTVPSCGYLLESDRGSLLYTGDTGPSDLIWKVASEAESLRAIIAETSFPNRYTELAAASGHLTPAMLAGEVKRYRLPDIPIYVYGMKPKHHREIVREVESLGDPRLRLLTEGTTLRLGEP